MKKFALSVLLGAAALAYTASGASASTLSDVKAKGFIQCGVNTGLLGFAQPDASGNWAGFDVDFCKAVASAVFGDATKVKYTPSAPRIASPRCSPAKSICCRATRPGPSTVIRRSVLTSARSPTMTAKASWSARN